MTTTELDFGAARRRFVTLEQRVYLASHCMGPLLRETLDDFADYGRSVQLRNRAIELWLPRLDELRALLQRLLNAEAQSIALGANATGCHAQFAAALAPSTGRNRILTTSLDFPSLRYLWHAQSARGFEVCTVTSPDGVHMPAEALLEAIDERTAVVAVSVASYFNGAMLPLRALVERAHAHGAIVVLDAYQAVGIVPIDVAALGIDVLIAGTHKWLSGGGTGLAFTYVRPDLAARLQPAHPGWLGHADASRYDARFTPAEGARRFEQGTPAMEPVYTARAGLRFVVQAGVDTLRARNLQRVRHLIEGARAHGIPVLTPEADAERGGMLCLGVDDAQGIAQRLAQQGIDVDTRPHSGLRVSPHPLTTHEECEHFLERLVHCLGR